MKMKLPNQFTKDKKIYFLLKEYKNYGLYEQEKTKIKECFSIYDINMLEKISILKKLFLKEI